MCSDENVRIDSEGDYVWRFPLHDRAALHVPHGEPLYPDEEVTEYFGQLITSLLNLVVLTVEGEEVKVDGFAFRNNPSKIYQLVERYIIMRDEESG